MSVGRIPPAIIVAQVKRKKEGIRPVEFGGHVHFIGIHYKMNHAPAKMQQRLCNVALQLVLVLAVDFCVLPCPGVF